MKKIFFLIACCLSACGFVACSVDTDGSAETTMTYQGVVDNIVLADSADTVYLKYIEAGLELKSIAIVGDSSQFSETAKVKNGTLQEAMGVCHQKAGQTYGNKLTTVTPTVFRNTLTATYGDSVDFADLDRFDVNLILYTIVGVNPQKVATYKLKY